MCYLFLQIYAKELVQDSFMDCSAIVFSVAIPIDRGFYLNHRGIGNHKSSNRITPISESVKDEIHKCIQTRVCSRTQTAKSIEKGTFRANH